MEKLGDIESSQIEEDRPPVVARNTSEESVLAIDREINNKIKSENHRQQLKFRRHGLHLAITVLLILGFFEIILICQIGEMIQKNNPGFSSLIILSVSHVISATAITVIILVSIFRGFHSKELDNISITQLKELLGDNLLRFTGNS